MSIHARRRFLLGLILILTGCAIAPSPVAAARPNIVLVISDDQNPADIDHMPWLSSQAGWTSFDSAYANQPLCCPSRATLFSGQYAHHHGVTHNDEGEQFRDRRSLAPWLQRAGYRTGLFGKYLNNFPWNRKRSFVPPGWARWLSFFHLNGRYYDYRLSRHGRLRHFGGSPRDYSTDVFARAAERFVARAPEPFFAVFSPFAVHGPSTPAPRHEGAFDGADPVPPPNFNLVASDQPRFFRRLGPYAPAAYQERTRRRWESALAIDDGVRGIVRELRQRGRLDNTVLLYLSDNGSSLGSHRYRHKNCLYQECVRVPLRILHPAGTTGSVASPVSTVDIARTIAGLARAHPTIPQDGRDLSRMVAGTDPWPADRAILLEVHRGGPSEPPSGWAVVTRHWKYAVHKTGEKELYDLDQDPYELENLSDDPAHDETQARMAERLRRLRKR